MPLSEALAAAHARLTTPRDLLRFAVSRFNAAQLAFGHGSGNAYDEAAYLILHTLHLPLDRLEPFLDAVLLDEEIAALLEVIRRRVEDRVPAAYLTAEAWLGEHRFVVDERVIVPRSFIAELLCERLAPWIDGPQSIGSVLDLCCGSGCLAILAALAFPAATVHAADISRDALDVARHNITDYGLAGRVLPIESDLFGALAGNRYRLIVSNPPYVDAPSMAALPEEYRREPRLALDGGSDGLDCIRVILHNAAAHLAPDGLLVVEIGHNRTALEAAFPHLPLQWLEVSAGDEFVFLLTREDLQAL